MLSRIAESLFWIGRYVERAEDTSRILDVHLSLLLDDPWAAEDIVCASLLSAMGHEPARRPARGRRGARDPGLGPHARRRRSLGALAAARENARRSREIVSTELWESDQRHLARGRPAGPARRTRTRSCTWVRERAAAFSGVADATLSRDEAWHFLVLGRSHRARRHDRAAGRGPRTRRDAGPSWVTLLQSCGAYQAFLRSANGRGRRRAGRPSSCCSTRCSRAR